MQFSVFSSRRYVMFGHPNTHNVLYIGNCPVVFTSHCSLTAVEHICYCMMKIAASTGLVVSPVLREFAVWAVLLVIAISAVLAVWAALAGINDYDNILVTISQTLTIFHLSTTLHANTYYTLPTTHCTQHTLQCTLHSAHCSLHTSQFTFHTALCVWHCTTQCWSNS